jgi:hypothetical protein
MPQLAIDHIGYLVTVDDISNYNIDQLKWNKPKNVKWIATSMNEETKHNTFIMECSGVLDDDILRIWFAHYRK